MRRRNRFQTPIPLSHGNQRKLDRIQYALQGRAERGLIKLARGKWNDHFLAQASTFPDPLDHDDMLDALAYVDQMSTVVYSSDLGGLGDTYWEPLDAESGF